MKGLWLILVGLFAWSSVASTARAWEPEASGFQDAVAAYRAGDLESAQAEFEELLGQPLKASDRALLHYDLGNIAFRKERFLEAVGHYTAAIEDAPRNGDMWHNLELARSRAGLDAADGGDLAATVSRLLSMPSDVELLVAAWILVGLLVLGLVAEVLLGGRATKVFVGLAALLLIGDVGLVQVRAWQHVDRPGILIAEGGAEMHSEPNAALGSGLRVPPAGRLAILDRLGPEGNPKAWVKVESEGRVGWLPEVDVLSW